MRVYRNQGRANKIPHKKRARDQADTTKKGRVEEKKLQNENESGEFRRKTRHSERKGILTNYCEDFGEEEEEFEAEIVRELSNFVKKEDEPQDKYQADKCSDQEKLSKVCRVRFLGKNDFLQTSVKRVKLKKEEEFQQQQIFHDQNKIQVKSEPQNLYLESEKNPQYSLLNSSLQQVLSMPQNLQYSMQSPYYFAQQRDQFIGNSLLYQMAMNQFQNNFQGSLGKKF